MASKKQLDSTIVYVLAPQTHYRRPCCISSCFKAWTTLNLEMKALSVNTARAAQKTFGGPIDLVYCWAFFVLL